ncbi:MAG: hypothetical protein JHC31_01215 [Sulfurihydrogenibium sp.]|nr:hypothetical protein [Sulfurihydrogenibium sp.]
MNYHIMVPEGYRKALESIGIKIEKRKLSRIYRFMSIRVLYPPPKTTILNKENKKYPYLLNQITTTQNQTKYGAVI